jgi:putative acetyltransferase
LVQVQQGERKVLKLQNLFLFIMMYVRTNSENKDFIELVRLLDEDLKIRDGEDHAFYASFNKTGSLKHVIVAYENNNAVACGALRDFNKTTVELKRMFVVENKRRMGLASGMVNELEKWAKELGYKTCVLETGKEQPEAIGLYLKMGFELTEKYGQYAGMGNSVCFRKVIY